MLPLWLTKSSVIGTLRELDRAKCKIAWSTYQIVGSVAVSLSVEWPPMFQDFLDMLSIFSLDFISPNCVADNPSFYRMVIVWTITPVIISGLLGLSLVAQSAQAFVKYSADDARKSAAELINVHLTYFLVLSFLVLPPVLLKQ